MHLFNLSSREASPGRSRTAATRARKMPAGSRRYSGASSAHPMLVEHSGPKPRIPHCVTYLKARESSMKSLFAVSRIALVLLLLAFLVARVEAQAVPALENIKSQEELEKAIRTLDAALFKSHRLYESKSAASSVLMAFSSSSCDLMFSSAGTAWASTRATRIANSSNTNAIRDTAKRLFIED